MSFGPTAPPQVGWTHARDAYKTPLLHLHRIAATSSHRHRGQSHHIAVIAGCSLIAQSQAPSVSIGHSPPTPPGSALSVAASSSIVVASARIHLRRLSLRTLPCRTCMSPPCWCGRHRHIMSAKIVSGSDTHRVCEGRHGHV